MNRFEIATGKKSPPIEPIQKPVQEKKRKPENSIENRVEQDERETLIAESLRTGQGRATLATSMATPGRALLDARSLARRVLMVDPLPAGALPMYPNSVPPIIRYAINGDREIVPIEDGELVPFFEIAANPQIPLNQIRRRRFDMIERAQDLAHSQIVGSENEMFVSLLDNTLSRSDRNLITDSAILTRDIFMDAFATVEREDLRVANILMNASDYGDFRKWGRDLIDPNNNRATLSNGYLSSIWGAQVSVSRSIEPGVIFMTAEPQFIGVLPVRTDLTVLPADDPVNMMIGFSFFEQIGMSCMNSRGGVRIVLRGKVKIVSDTLECWTVGVGH